MKKLLKGDQVSKTFFKSLALLAVLSSVLIKDVFAEDWVYTVRQGDTLWDLCLEYTVEQGCWMKIGPYNQVDFPPSLAPGTRIKFPTSWLKNQPAEVEILYLRGDVFIFENGDQRSAVLNERLKVGTTIETGEEASVTLRFADGSSMLVEENSRLSLDTLSQHGESGMVDSRLRLLKGRINNTITKRQPRSRFRVTTPSSVAAVRGTEFSVSADSMSTRGSVYDGEIVMISQADDADEKGIVKGFGIVAKKGETLPEPEKLLPAVSFGDFQNQQTLPAVISWQAVDGAQQYVLQVLSDTANDELLLTRETDQASLEIVDLGEECYRIQINAIAISGITGMPAETQLCIVFAPEGLTVERLSKEEVELTWQHAGENASFLVEVATDENFENKIAQMNTEETRVRLKLEKQKQAYFRVQSLGQASDQNAPQVLAESEMVEIKEESDAWILLYIFLPLLLAL